MNRLTAFGRDLSLSAVVAGFVAMLVGVTSSIVVVFQAAQALGADAAQVTSWIWATCIGTGLTSLGLSVWYRRPVLTAWSTPGAAMLVSAAAGVTLPEAIGGFVVSALLIALSGATGLFARVMDRIPQPLAAGLLGGVLARFALDAFAAMHGDPLLVGTMFLAYLLGRRLWPR
ncbi:MAG: benzoate transporter BenE, partial [Pseudomonadota bacterium]